MSPFSTRTVAAAATLALTLGSVAFSVPAGASTPTSSAAGRFLSGEAGGTNFDTVLALNGEQAAYPGNPGPRQNDLSGSLLGHAVSGPTRNISVPFPSGITFGAVGQYAKAAADGSAFASSGLIGSNGAVNVSGSGNTDLATIDLSALPNASALTDVLGNLVLHIGAVSATAKQAVAGHKLADPSTGCTNSSYQRVSARDQGGSYQFANLRLTATSPLLKQLGSTLNTTLGTVFTQLAAAANKLPGGLVAVSGIPTGTDIAKALTLTFPGGGITASLADGTFTIDLAKILKAAGVDINNLCPNTSLLPYLSDALSNIPGALATLFTSLTSSFTGVIVKVAGTPLSASALSALIDPFKTALTTNLTTVLDKVDGALTPALDAITQSLLDVVVNAQDQSGATFTETAVQVDLIPNGGSLPSLPGMPSLPTLPSSGLSGATRTATSDASAQMKRDRSGNSSSAGSPSNGAGAPSGVSVPGLPHSAVHGPVSMPIALGPRTVAAAATPVLRLDLASAAVSNATVASVATPTSPAAATAAAAGTQLPTGVPAGAAGHRGSAPATPLVLTLLGLLLATGGWAGYRRRVRTRH